MGRNPSKLRKKSRLESASSVLQTLLQNSKSPLSQQFDRWRLWKCWPDVVGAELARCTLPVGYQRGRLYIWVNHSARLQELTYMAQPLREKINAYMGRRWVSHIRFTLDRKSVPLSAQNISEDLTVGAKPKA